MTCFSIITVAYRSLEPIKAMHRSIPAGVELILVDNSSEALLHQWACSQTNVRYIDPGHNLGFGAACNLGARHAQSEWLLFLNPDAVLPADIEKLFQRALSLFPSAVVISPVLRHADGSVYYKLRSQLTQPKSIPGTLHEAIQTPIIAGAAFFVNRQKFQAVGGFDERIFMYFEDDDLIWRLYQMSPEVYLLPWMQVEHTGDASSPKSLALSKFKHGHWGRSERYVLLKHRLYGQALWKSIELTFKLLVSPLLGAEKRLKHVYRWLGFTGCYTPRIKHSS